ncbi:RNA-binding ribosome biosynthesis protein MRD1 SCDLUD_002346 [Saccharomycodes ludwigii]|uniref:RNA-binding ribosome biosynthesis protein MRD1 n=1 Tax=Saccharomycodes ludwigii TaxID=36035 RepID=UPI001E8695F7|nr:hypothetical protein SCDLUD_002346 [Saccharomycodes ludwigii]KAH3900887.1 hypothetical protein SCDLUD_002346 [Saccharomycodes ludwigii]
MSRIIVKNLPKYVDENRLENHFLKRCESLHPSLKTSTKLITDVRLLKDKDGNSRKFAFIGYLNESDAFDAIKYFDGSFIDTAKIQVSQAKSFVDPRVPKPMKEKKREALKRLREKEEQLLEEKEMENNSNKKLKSNEIVNHKSSIDKEVEKNRLLREFMETMNPNKQSKSYNELLAKDKPEKSENSIITMDAEHNTNEEDAIPSNPLLATVMGLKNKNLKETGEESDDEYLDLHQKEQKDAEIVTNEKEEESAKEDEQMVSLDAFESTSDGLAKDEQVTDLDWLKNRRVRIRERGLDKATKDEDVKSEKEKDNHEEKEVQNVVVDQEEINITKIKETGRLFLRNILYTSTEDDFRKLFSPFGELEEVHIALDTRTGKSKGFAYILFKNPEDAIQAYIELDKQIFQGRLLHILPADGKKSHRLDEFDLKNMPLKKQRELKKKASASKQTFQWNSLYMNQDAVLNSVAAKLGMKKSELLDPESTSSAVKHALAEASVIGDVRKYFEKKGVDLTSFENTKRDDSVLLVKNFPYGTTKENLAELFLPFGKLKRLLLPPAGTIAIVQYRDITSAKAAFTKLSYKRFKDTILYLEKGPVGCFTRGPEGDELIDSNEEETYEIEVKEIKPSMVDIISDSQAKEMHVDGPTTSIFVKNLNFTTTSQDLVAKFNTFDGFVVAQVKTKPDPKDNSKTLSMGFGFVEFKTKDQADTVIKTMDGAVIDGHKIQLKLSHRQNASAGSSSNSKNKGKPSSKIIVKNLPFEATRKDVFELFGSFGQLKSVRVPKKFDKSARGFAFVEFLLPKEAENAMDQLQGVHLLGRRLVMQYAEQDAEDAEEKIERMTKKVKKQMNTRELANMRNSTRGKFDIGKEDDKDIDF